MGPRQEYMELPWFLWGRPRLNTLRRDSLLILEYGSRAEEADSSDSPEVHMNLAEVHMESTLKLIGRRGVHMYPPGFYMN
jgi:hypothetical protein